MNDDDNFALDPSDPLYMLLSNAHDGKQDQPYGMSYDLNDLFVDPNALFIDNKSLDNLQPQDLLNPAFFSSPTLSSASASTGDSPAGFTPSSPESTRDSPAISRPTTDPLPPFFPHPFVGHFPPHMLVQQTIPPQPVQGPQTHVINTTVTARPKTSHTTIERRYRTNLNARIQSLKAAVPALRVLDQNSKNDEYKVDERGYIDGVKVARKGSKANVLGKAVEYIRVLKRREARLEREQDGLRNLICGFPGGQNVLSEWDMEWKKKFGGPEKDEIDCNGAEEASDDEDVDGEDDGDTSERARKRPRVDPSKKEKRKIAPATPVPSAPGVVEKRKRGRPRKIQPSIPPPVTAAAPIPLADPSQQGILVAPMAPQSAQPQQYLLAVFAIFSFFNSPLASTSQPVAHHHTHQGSVLSHTTPAYPAQPVVSWTWNDAVQVVHLLASLAMFVSIVIPWIPVPRRAYQSRLLQLIPFEALAHQAHASPPHETSDLPTPPGSPDGSDSGSDPDSSSTEYTVRATKEVPHPLAVALSSRGAPEEFDNILGALNVGTGWFGMIRGSVGIQYGSDTRCERQAWTRLAELVVLSEKVSMPVRWQAYNHISSRLGSARAQVASETLVSDLCTAALLARSVPFSEAQSQVFWARARELVDSHEVPAYQRLVLDSMAVEEAVEYLSSSKGIPSSSPIVTLASSLLRKRLHSHASSLFIRRVSQGLEGNSGFPSIENSKEWNATVSYGRSLGGDIGLLSDALVKAWQDGCFSHDVSDLKVDTANEGISSLLRATVLYSQVFTSQFVPSPPPSPPLKVDGKESGADVVLNLRRALGSNVFEESGESDLEQLSLEDARDRVVDMIVNLQRERRTRAG